MTAATRMNIEHAGKLLVQVLRAGDVPEKTTFLTSNDATLQVGQIVYRAGTAVPRHTHVPVQRSIDRTAEVLVVQRGRCALDVYADDHSLVATVELAVGDVVALHAGGHGFRMSEDTVLLEVKQGPYFGVDEKVRF